MNKRQIILIVIVIAIGALLGALILTWNKAATPEAAHGGHDKSDLSHAAHDNHDHGDHDKAGSTNGPHAHPGPLRTPLFAPIHSICRQW